MENLTHTLTGLVISRTGRAEGVPFATGTLMAAANLPDLDILATLSGELYYLHYHRGLTHSIFGTLLLGTILALAVWAFRGWSRAGREGRTTFRATLFWTNAAALTHPLLDFTNNYGVRLLQPFSDWRSFGDFVFIVDPYLWFFLGMGAFLSSERTRWTRIPWAILFFAVLTVVGLFSFSNREGVPALVVLIAGAIVAVWLQRKRASWGTRAAFTSLILVVLYWGFLLASHFGAETFARSLAPPPTTAPPWTQAELLAIPRPAHPLSWDVVAMDEEAVHIARVDLLQSRLSDLHSYPRNLEMPEVKAALSSCAGEVLRRFGRFDFYEVLREGSETTVIFRDARFAREGDTGFGVFSIPLSSELEPEVEEPCPVQGPLTPRIAAAVQSTPNCLLGTLAWWRAPLVEPDVRRGK